MISKYSGDYHKINNFSKNTYNFLPQKSQTVETQKAVSTVLDNNIVNNKYSHNSYPQLEKVSFSHYSSFQDIFNADLKKYLLENPKQPGFSNYNDFFNNQPKERQEVFTKIAEQIEEKNNGKLDVDTVIVSPVYSREENMETFIETLKNSTPKNVPIILYINAPEHTSSGDVFVSKKEFKTSKNEIQQLIGNDPRFLVTDNHYNTRETISVNRADMIGGTLKAMKNPMDVLIISRDADTYKQSPEHIENIQTFFKKNPAVAWGASELCWTDEITKAPATWFSEQLLQLTCQGGIMNACDKNSPHSFGAVLSFKGGAYLQSGGFRPTLKKFEDLALGKDMNNLENYKNGTWIPNSTVHSNNRRCRNELEKGGIVANQWSDDFTPVNSQISGGEKLQYLDTITQKLLTGGILSNEEKTTIENFIYKHFIHEKTETRREHKFLDFWKKYGQNASYYPKIRATNKVIFEKK